MKCISMAGLNPNIIRSLAKDKLTSANICNTLKELEEWRGKLGTSQNIGLRGFYNKLMSYYQ